MNATTRGITEHEVLMMIETTRQRLDLLDITGPIADRLIMIFVFGALGDTAEEARGVADRLFPVTIETTKEGDDGNRD